MELSVWIALVALFIAGGLTPGPAVIMVVASALTYGFWPAMTAALGVCAANLLWVALAALGAATIATAFPAAFLALKLGGVAFILWMAWRMAFSAAAVDFSAQKPPRRRTLLLRGAGLQMANPNALIYFGGLLPAYVDLDRDLPTQLVIMGVTITATELLGLSIYASAAHALAQRFRSPAFARMFNRGAAVLMAGSAVFAIAATWRF